MPFARFLAGRLVKGVLVLLAIAVLNFFLIRAAPGDPAQVMAGEAGAADAVFLQQLRERFGLDRPVAEQLWIYLQGYLTLDLGFSYRQGRPVLDLIAERLPATLLLTGAAFAISLALGILLGALAARRAGRWSDSAITTRRAPVLRHAALLDCADGPDRLLAEARLAAERRLRDHRGRLYRPRPRRRHRPPPRPAGADARAVLHGALRPHDARLDAGGGGQRLRQDGAGQGPCARGPCCAATSPATPSCRS